MTTLTRSTPTLRKRVLAFDPGFERLGAAVLDREGGKEVLVYSDCIRTSPTLTFTDRLKELGLAVEALITTYTPTTVALEDVYFAKNEKTAMKIAEVRGVLAYLAAKNNLIIYEYTPMQVKVAITGYGKSDKAAVSAMVPRLVALEPKKRLDDELDAIAIGLTCLASVR